jgi:hypothetical protein
MLSAIAIFLRTHLGFCVWGSLILAKFDKLGKYFCTANPIHLPETPKGYEQAGFQ